MCWGGVPSDFERPPRLLHPHRYAPADRAWWLQRAARLFGDRDPGR
ncbi:MAG: hypothetical protein OWV35_08190 [Firmicutes bacterium]|nr:hypothetical protein [Bacillota bacterium]